MAGARPAGISRVVRLGFVPLSKTGAELLFEIISQRYERLPARPGSIIITSNLPFDEWTEVFGAENASQAGLPFSIA